MSQKPAPTTARDGWVTLVLSLLLWGGLLGLFLFVGHSFASRPGH